MSIQPTALITGANKGIGLSIAKGLGKQGYHVWIGSRDADRGRAAVEALEAEGIDARVLLLDVSEPSSVEAAAAFLQRQIGSLDVLVNNAGINLGASTPPSEQPMDELKAVYEVNVFGAVRVTQSFVKLLKAATNARVVMMSSGLGSLGLVTNPESIYSTANLLAYNSSKTALNAVAVAFAKEFKPFGIKVNAVEPGNVATDLNGNTGALTPDEGATSAIMLATIGPDGPTGQFFGVDGPQPW